MGVLDRLEREARESRERREAAASARTGQDSAARTRLSPALDRAARYLERLAASLGDSDNRIETHYELEDAGVLAGLHQEAYRVSREEGAGEGVRLLFECTGPSPLEFKVDGHAKVEPLVRSLRDAGLRCSVNPVSKRVLRVRVEPRVPVRVDFSPDVERGCVWLELRNLGHLGGQRYPLAPERVDEELLDAVACLVLREPSHLAELTGSVIAGSQRADLRRRLAREQRARDAQLAGGVRAFVFPLTEWFRRTFLGG